MKKMDGLKGARLQAKPFKKPAARMVRHDMTHKFPGNVA